MKNSFFVRSAILLTLLVAATSVPASAYAQGSDTSRVVSTPQPAPATPNTTAKQQSGAAKAPTTAWRSKALAPVNMPPQNLQVENVGRDKAQMGVGLASIVVGIIAGGEIGTLFMIAGGVIGLVGLYNYMR